MTERYFTGSDTWTGGYFELAMELGNSSDAGADQRFYQALTAIWQHPSLDGCYLDNSQEPAAQNRIKPQMNWIESGHKLYGLATLLNGYKVACATMLFREGEGKSDWLEFMIPMEALQKPYDVRAYMGNDDPTARRWIVPLEAWFADIGKFVFDIVPFQVGKIGWEVYGRTFKKDTLQKGIPPQRWLGLLWPENGKVEYYPSNN